MHTVLGIDLGTQSVKVVFYDFEARKIVAVQSMPLRLHQTPDGVAEQRVQWWLEALGGALSKVDRAIRQSVLAIGVSGQQHGFVPLNSDGNVLAPVKLWCDTSTQAECEAVMDATGGREACIATAGNPILPGYTASKIRWFRDAHPDLYAQMTRILLPHDYLNFYLTGQACMEAGDASGTGLLDVRQRQWSTSILAAIDPTRDLTDCLPAVQTTNVPIGELLPSAAEALSLPAGVPVSIGGGDNMMSAIGTGNVSPGAVTLSLGTSGTVSAYSDTPIIDPQGNVAAFCSSNGGWLPLSCTMNCTVGSESIRRLIGADIDDFESILNASPKGAEGVVTLPFFNGERTPNLPNAKGVVLGLDTHNSRTANFLRSAVEGATYALRFGFDQMKALGINSNEIMLTGGGANSGAWRQIVADVFNTPVSVLETDEGAAFGAALQAVAMLSGEHTDLLALTRQHLVRDDSRCCIPASSAVNFYNDAYQHYQRAVEQIATFYAAPQSQR